VDLSKYEILINELSSIEAEVATLKDQLRDNTLRTDEMETVLMKLRQENSLLKSKLTELEIENENLKKQPDTFNILNSKERETLKLKLQDVISRIDYHLSADRQV
jgi:predicted nuclease with TOPRIM domain